MVSSAANELLKKYKTKLGLFPTSEEDYEKINQFREDDEFKYFSWLPDEYLWTLFTIEDLQIFQETENGEKQIVKKLQDAEFKNLLFFDVIAWALTDFLIKEETQPDADENIVMEKKQQLWLGARRAIQEKNFKLSPSNRPILINKNDLFRKIDSEQAEILQCSINFDNMIENPLNYWNSISQGGQLKNIQKIFSAFVGDKDRDKDLSDQVFVAENIVATSCALVIMQDLLQGGSEEYNGSNSEELFSANPKLDTPKDIETYLKCIREASWLTSGLEQGQQFFQNDIVFAAINDLERQLQTSNDSQLADKAGDLGIIYINRLRVSFVGGVTGQIGNIRFSICSLNDNLYKSIWDKNDTIRLSSRVRCRDQKTNEFIDPEVLCLKLHYLIREGLNLCFFLYPFSNNNVTQQDYNLFKSLLEASKPDDRLPYDKLDSTFRILSQPYNENDKESTPNWEVFKRVCTIEKTKHEQKLRVGIKEELLPKINLNGQGKFIDNLRKAKEEASKNLGVDDFLLLMEDFVDPESKKLSKKYSKI